MDRPEQQSLYDSNDYYSNDADASRLSASLNWILRYLDSIRVTKILKVTRLTGGSALDVGAGNGMFLSFLRKRGFNVFGTTASARGQAAARQIFDLHLEYTTELNSAVLARTYDLVSYWHVYEHLVLPSSHSSKWSSLVKSGGWLIIEVPNISSIGAKICYSSWLGSDDVHHVNHQKPADIIRTLNSEGFIPVCIEGFSLKFSVIFMWSALLGFCFGKSYCFDNIMQLLKTPFSCLKKRPFWAINAILSLIYFAPAVGLLVLYGMITGQGEVFRVFAKKS
jgi:2-polyprenyl-3-methyl-5-hydroxy-6-metoxy-1,4-benzoquinol methylase